MSTEWLSTKLEQITAELEKRDFSDVLTAKLVELELKTHAELATEFAESPIRSEHSGTIRPREHCPHPPN